MSAIVRAMRLLTSSWVTTILVACTLFSTTPAFACKCMVPTVEAARADAAALFEGRVLDVAKQTREGEMPRVRATLAVVRTWKGLDREERVEVLTNKDSAACGYEFEKDESYLVYAQRNDGVLHVSLCSRTRPMAEASEDLKVLGAGSTPVHIEPKSDAPDAAVDATGAGAGAGPKPDAPAPKSPKKRGCTVAMGGGATDESVFALLIAALALTMRSRGSRRRVDASAEASVAARPTSRSSS